jgi:hypothetical protein
MHGSAEVNDERPAEPDVNVKPKRRWLRFSLKTMLVVMTLMSIPLGWLAYERNEVSKRKAAIAAIEKLGGHVNLFADQPFCPDWLDSLLDENSVGEVVSVTLSGTDVNDVDLANLTGLTKLEILELDHTQVSDAGLAELSGLTNVDKLFLGNTSITDDGLVHLTGLTKLNTLFLSSTKLTDASLVHLAGLTELEWMDLEGTQVTDAGLIQLTGLPKLKWIDLRNTRVTDHGASELKKALPNLDIVR